MVRRQAVDGDVCVDEIMAVQLPGNPQGGLVMSGNVRVMSIPGVMSGNLEPEVVGTS